MFRRVQHTDVSQRTDFGLNLATGGVCYKWYGSEFTVAGCGSFYSRIPARRAPTNWQLFQAIESGINDTALDLLSRRANPNAAANMGLQDRSVLAMAASKGNTTLCTHLLEANANVDYSCAPFNVTALHAAAEGTLGFNGSSEQLKCPVHKMTHTSVVPGNAQTVACLLRARAGVNVATVDSVTALMLKTRHRILNWSMCYLNLGHPLA